MALLGLPDLLRPGIDLDDFYGSTHYPAAFFAVGHDDRTVAGIGDGRPANIENRSWIRRVQKPLSVPAFDRTVALGPRERSNA